VFDLLCHCDSYHFPAEFPFSSQRALVHAHDAHQLVAVRQQCPLMLNDAPLSTGVAGGSVQPQERARSAAADRAPEAYKRILRRISEASAAAAGAVMPLHHILPCFCIAFSRMRMIHTKSSWLRSPLTGLFVSGDFHLSHRRPTGLAPAVLALCKSEWAS